MDLRTSPEEPRCGSEAESGSWIWGSSAWGLQILPCPRGATQVLILQAFCETGAGGGGGDTARWERGGGGSYMIDGG